MRHDATETHNRPIAIWLLTVCFLIFCMVVLGGVTRLTHSGLSMVEWDPIMGVLPPTNTEAWETAFSKYKQSPEYQKINFGMSLHGFKKIFYFEYAHRVLGRGIGLAFLLPFLYFLIRKKIQPALIPKLTIMFILGGLQGLLGWYMVKSGLVDIPRVSPYRLTAHLLMAFVIYWYILWVALGLLSRNQHNTSVANIAPLRRFGKIVTTTIVLMIITGGFVAGTRAGFAYNTFPLMGDSLIPGGMFVMQPFYINFFENIATVQFDHRLIAYVLFFMVPIFWLRVQKSDVTHYTKRVAHLLMLMLGIQIGLGISTLLLHVPVALGAMHQGGALLLLTLAIMINHALRRQGQAAFAASQQRGDVITT